MVEIPNISEELISGFCDFVTKINFAGTGRVLETGWLGYVVVIIVFMNKYAMCRFLILRIIS
jgi:hypothetical protein